MKRGDPGDIVEKLAARGEAVFEDETVLALLEAIPYEVVLLGADGAARYVNSAAAFGLGLSKGAVVPQGLLDDRTPGRDVWRRTASGRNGAAAGTILLARRIGRKSKKRDAEGEVRMIVQRLRSVMEPAACGVYVVDRNGRHLMANSALGKIHGIPPSEIEGVFIEDLFPEDVALSVKRSQELVFSTGAPFCGEMNLCLDDGARSFIVSRFPLVGGGGEPVAVCGIVTEITKLKESMAALRANEEKYRLLAENIADIVWVMDKDFKYTYVSPSVERVLGWTPDEMMTIPWRERLTPDSREKMESVRRRGKENLRAGRTPKASSLYSLRQLRKDGTVAEVEVRITPLFDDADEFTGVLGVTRDVGERVRAERELKRSEEKYRGIFEASAEGVFQFLPDGSLMECNPAMAGMLGRASAKELLDEKTDILEQMHVEPAERMEFLRLLATEGRVLDYEARIRRADGRKIWISTNARAVLDEYGRLVCMEGAARDITVRKRAEEERMLLVAAVEQTAEGVVIVGPEYSAQYANPAFRRLIGLEDSVKGFRRLLNEHVKPFLTVRARRTLQRGEQWSGRVRHCGADGRRYAAEALITPIRDEKNHIINHVVLARDVTYEIELEKRLRQAEKLEAVGVLAAGVAHDFNNILTPILLNTEVALADLPENHPLSKPLGDVYAASEKARDLVKQLLTFSRSRGRTAAPFPLAPLVKENVKLLRGMVDEDVEILDEIAEEDLVVKADPAQIHQVVMNLGVNAAQAMRPGGGRMWVVLARKIVAAAEARRGLRPGAYAELAVRDTGHGMDPEVARRVFEPFFTTKGPGRGMGMGLAAVHGIVKACGGAVSVESESGRGSLFTVLLPLVNAA